MERRLIYIEGIALEELWFNNRNGAVRGGISFMGTDMIFDPVSKSVMHGGLEGADWLYSMLDPHESRHANNVIEAVVGTLMYSVRKELSCKD